jgi:hypothetical protein
MCAQANGHELSYDSVLNACLCVQTVTAEGAVGIWVHDHVPLPHFDYGTVRLNYLRLRIVL